MAYSGTFVIYGYDLPYEPKVLGKFNGDSWEASSVLEPYMNLQKGVPVPEYVLLADQYQKYVRIGKVLAASELFDDKMCLKLDKVPAFAPPPELRKFIREYPGYQPELMFFNYVS